MSYLSVEQTIGNTPLVKLQYFSQNSTNIILAKLEGNNPAGSVKDRAVLSMVEQAEIRKDIKPGDTIIEATSGNTGIALAMIAAIKKYHVKLIMPENMTEERKAAMQAYGAELVLVSEREGMEGARDLASKMVSQGKGISLNQFANLDNPLGHYQNTAKEIWQETRGEISHFISSMGTTGTIMGSSKFFKQKKNSIQIIGVQPSEGSKIAGIRRWSEEYLPKIYEAKRIDQIIEVSQKTAEITTKNLAKFEGVCAGPSAGGALAVALQISQEVQNATIVFVVPDRGDRYLSSGLFNLI